MSKETTSTLRVSGWHCGGCSGATEGALRKVPGVKSANANLEQGTVAVTFDESAVSLAQLAKVVEKVGYQVIAG